jgi:cytosine/creatinine deaminase
MGDGIEFVIWNRAIIAGIQEKHIQRRAHHFWVLAVFMLFQQIDYLQGTAMDPFLAEAIIEARKGFEAGGIPIGSVLVIDGEIVGRGHNQRVQKSSPILHAEMDCIENAGRLSAAEYRRATLYSTLSPCDMCSGTALLYGIPSIVVGENKTFQGPEQYVRSRGVDLTVVDNDQCYQLLQSFIQLNPELWWEDIGTLF